MRQLNERRTVVLDGHPLWLEAVQRVLARVGVTTVFASTSPDNTVAAIERERPDLLIVGADLQGKGGGGLEVARAARKRFPEMRVIVLGEDRSTGGIAAAFDAGASAYVLKSVHPEDLAAAVRQTFGPSIYFADAPGQQQAARDSRRAAATDGAGLTRREVEILRLVAEGYSNAALARLLWVTEQTVKFHLSNIYRKLDVANRTEAARWAQLHGLLEPDASDEAPSPRPLPAFAAAAS